MTIKLQGSSSGHVNLDAKATAANNTITLPDTASGELVAADSSGHINLADSKMIKLGTGGDLTITHDGSDAKISNDTGAFVIQDSHAGANAVIIRKGAEVELLHNNALKFETTATGVNVTGGIRLGGNNAANECDDYEEGTWTPHCQYWNGSAYVNNTHVAGSPGDSTAYYTKIGNIVSLSWYSVGLKLADGHGSSAALGNLPFAAISGYQGYQVGSIAHATCFEQHNQNGYTTAGSNKFQFTREHLTSGNTWKDSSVTAEYLMVTITYRTT